MRPRTKGPIPEPKESGFENFNRLAGLLMRVKPKKKKVLSLYFFDGVRDKTPKSPGLVSVMFKGELI